MAAASGVFCQKDIAGTEAPPGAVANLDFTLPGQVDHLLPSRRPMPVMEATRRSVAKGDSLPRLKLLDLHLDLVEMRLAVRSGIDSRDFHGSGLMKNSAVKYKI